MEHARPPSELSLEGNSVSRADAWKRWRKQFHLSLKASGVHKEEGSVQASLLINLIGTEGFDVYETFKFSNDTEKDDVTVLLKKFDEYFGVKPNVTLARYNFYMRNQEGGESIDQYVTALKLLSKTCEFKTLEEEFIRDRIVCGIKNTIVRDRLLRTDDLTMDKAIKICKVDEVSADSSRVLQESRGASAGPVRVDAVGARGGAGPRAARSPAACGPGWREAPAASFQFICVQYLSQVRRSVCYLGRLSCGLSAVLCVSKLWSFCKNVSST
ncbi:uncharacterized protein LOC134200371 [Bombyx mori]|uniref:uncharacterized protein LOC134200371 n=1 Tax=Bombyx mori TaxID=7091 RepID=UPI002ED21808